MNTEVATQELNTIQDSRTSSLALITNDGNMARLMSLAKLMAGSKVTVPKHLQGNEGDCMAIIIQATNWGMNPFAVSQKTHLVNGVLGYEAQLVNAVICVSGAIVGGFEYEYMHEGLAMECRVGAIIRGKSEITWGEWLCVNSVKTKNSPLWGTNPKQQLGYLQVKNWGRLYTPGAILGVYSTDELEEIDITPAAARTATPRTESGGTAKAAAKPALEYCTDARFEELSVDKLDRESGEITAMGWKSIVQSGKRSAQALIAMIEAKYLFTEPQKEIILSWEPIEGNQQ